MIIFVLFSLFLKCVDDDADEDGKYEDRKIIRIIINLIIVCSMSC